VSVPPPLRNPSCRFQDEKTTWDRWVENIQRRFPLCTFEQKMNARIEEDEYFTEPFVMAHADRSGI
jgi:hypothetical protein